MTDAKGVAPKRAQKMKAKKGGDKGHLYQKCIKRLCPALLDLWVQLNSEAWKKVSGVGGVTEEEREISNRLSVILGGGVFEFFYVIKTVERKSVGVQLKPSSVGLSKDESLKALERVLMQHSPAYICNRVCFTITRMTLFLERLWARYRLKGVREKQRFFDVLRAVQLGQSKIISSGILRRMPNSKRVSALHEQMLTNLVVSLQDAWKKFSEITSARGQSVKTVEAISKLRGKRLLQVFCELEDRHVPMWSADIKEALADSAPKSRRAFYASVAEFIDGLQAVSREFRIRLSQNQETGDDRRRLSFAEDYVQKILQAVLETGVLLDMPV